MMASSVFMNLARRLSSSRWTSGGGKQKVVEIYKLDQISLLGLVYTYTGILENVAFSCNANLSLVQSLLYNEDSSNAGYE